MWLILALYLAVPVQDAPEPIYTVRHPSTWAAVLLRYDGTRVRTRNLRSVSCYGLEPTYVLCSWQQRIGWTWRSYSQYADISRESNPRLIPGTRTVE